MKILHISSECYPAAKVGGLADVVGSLPKYLNRSANKAEVIIPKYGTNWISRQKTKTVFEGKAPYNSDEFSYSVQLVKNSGLGFPLYLVDIPGSFDRPGIYTDPGSGKAYWDEMDRFFCFQIALLEWSLHRETQPDLFHCHDHHTGLVPFMITQCYRFKTLSSMPTVLTIHNGEYQGRYDRKHYVRLPAFPIDSIGLLDWNGELNALAAGIKTAWQVTTVSGGYMKELLEYCHGLEKLLRSEKEKTQGLLNGIDTEIWNPATDSNLKKTYTIRSRRTGKRANKEWLCQQFDFDPERPLFSFIGRLVEEKGASLLVKLIRQLQKKPYDLSLLVLGTGDPGVHQQLNELKSDGMGFFNSQLEYNESLAHRIYAGSDFLLMPSKVEPCGLNQMYAMRYGTMPVARATGGLKDTIVDLSEKNGYGILFHDYYVGDAVKSVERALNMYKNEKKVFTNSGRLMKLDFSWEKSSKNYIKLYKRLLQPQ